ncbi:ParB/RepB/Spo0J family partition protein [Streptomyces lavendulocolor]|uniref:ParB/RepB/Spo0J family partition protein n=1 Tax=Streptomyces lavendulocolor TaxID=67316 RepID=A0ABV2W8U0_9ACTN
MPLDALRTTETPRLSGRNDEHARVLCESPGPLPPIVVHRATMRVIDGAHRVHAARLRGEREVLARMFDGDERDAFVLAVRANITHGLPLTLADRISAAARIVGSHPHWSDRAIAAETGLSEHTVAGVRRRSTARPSQLNTPGTPDTPTDAPPADDAPQPTARLGRDGRLRPTDGARRRTLAGRLFAERPDATLREVARLAGISPATARDVRLRVNRGEDPVTPRQRSAARPTATGAGRTAPIASTAIIEQLTKDPSIRLSDTGRSLLSWLGTHLVQPADCAEVVARVPPHRSGQVARLARACAQNWHHIAHRLEECAATTE